jgi:uncharacterized membrane-anchored protein YjiN (DUF445 family)
MSSRLLAPLSLLLATLLFLATWPWKALFAVGLFHAFAEAAMIGGLADWFAVVALFRHPLGIPIPHTGILPRQRAKLTQAIADTVQNTWLAKDTILEYVREWKPATVLLASLDTPANRGAALALLRTVLAEIIRALDARAASRTVQEALRARITPEDIGRLLRRALDAAMEDGAHQRLLTLLAQQADARLGDAGLARRLAASLQGAADRYAASPLRRAARWMAERSNVLNYDDLAAALVETFRQDLRDMASDASHPLRSSLEDVFRQSVAGLEHDVHLQALVDNAWTAFTTSPRVAEQLEAQAQRAIAWLLDDASRPDSLLLGHAAGLLDAALLRFHRDPAALDAADAWIRDRLTHLVDTRHADIGALVRSNLNRLSDDEMTAQIERKVGADLQYIRVNGALVGGLVGALLYLLQAAF